MRSGINPYDYVTPEDLLARDFIGTNSGNLIYANGIYRNLVREDVEIYSDNYVVNLSNVDEINKNYDGYIIALADAIRSDFVGQLKNLTKVIKKLTIPVYLIGMGVRAPYDVNPEKLSFDFDNVIRDFINAVLEKSEIVGLRGNITAQYLSNLGFQEGKDHIAIGCPSMYTFGSNLKIRDVDKLLEDSLITTNLSKTAPLNIKQYLTELHEIFKNATFLPQGYDEFKLIYSGSSVFKSEGYPSTITDIQYSTGNPIFFLNAPTWIDYMRKVNFSFGTKLHGNITATIAGTPSITIPLDARMKELVEFHELTHLKPNEITVGTPLQDLLDMVDVHSPEKKHAENYGNFVNFLKTNGLNPVIQKEGETIYADYQLKQTELYPLVESSIKASEDEKLIRMASLNRGYYQKESNLRKSIVRLKSDNRNLRKRNIQLTNKSSELQSEIKKLENEKNRSQNEERIAADRIEGLIAREQQLVKVERQLNRKSVKMALNFADKLASIKKKLRQ